jgi:hypothetical protein
MKYYTGINIQFPISQKILLGEKIIETREYPLSDKYLMEELLLIETPGKTGTFKARIIAIIKFTECFKYKNQKEFYADIDKHFVDKSSRWAWKNKPKYGWQIKLVKKFKNPIPMTKRKGIIYTLGISLP